MTSSFSRTEPDRVLFGAPSADALLLFVFFQDHYVEMEKRIQQRYSQSKSPKVFTEAAVAEWYRYRTVACFVTGATETSRNMTVRVIERDISVEIHYFLEDSRGFRIRQRGRQIGRKPRRQK
ncbi:hypothetical protein TNCV_4880671 [Trichonephila clavipes]|nr:hypothetical protein TNCV_4880671 [Trichonephila clavipes]